MICATTLAGTPLSCAHDEYVRLNVSHVDPLQVRRLTGRPDPPTKTLFGEIGLPETVEKISSASAVALRPCFPRR